MAPFPLGQGLQLPSAQRGQWELQPDRPSSSSSSPAPLALATRPQRKEGQGPSRETEGAGGCVRGFPALRAWAQGKARSRPQRRVRGGLPWGRPPSLPSFFPEPPFGRERDKGQAPLGPRGLRLSARWRCSPRGGGTGSGLSLSLSRGFARDLAIAMAAWRSALRRARRLGCGWTEDAGPPPPTEALLARHGRLPPAPPPSRSLRTSAACCKNQAARVRVGKGDRPVSYEEAHPPHGVAHRKGWLSLGTSHLEGEPGAAERAVEDVFVRRFIHGTFHGCLADQVVLKRRANALVICAVFLQRLPPSKFYFLIGYTEALLSFLYKCPVKMEVQTLPEKVVYKYL